MRRASLCLLLLFLWCCGARAEEPADPLDRKFENWQAHRFHNIRKQRTDFTCGAASLAIISQGYYGKQVEEFEFTGAIRKTYSDEEWKQKEKDGLSLLDMKKAAEKMGFSAQGLKLTPRELFALKGPVVIHLDKGFIQHFAVFKGVQRDRAYIADPITGHSRVPVYRFLHEWTGYALAIWLEGKELPATNQLAVSPNDRANELDVTTGVLYPFPTTAAFSPVAQ